jgi:hypothetical protein
VASRQVVDELDLDILSAVKHKSGSNLKDIYMPLVRPGRTKTSLYQRMKRLSEAKFIRLKRTRSGREFKTYLTDKGRRLMKGAAPGGEE